ncbi:MAG: hypothetical protein KDE34_17115 [Anaerolineales bacterium]|nr:hypothetical protein [Anaerolineales bacterium]
MSRRIAIIGNAGGGKTTLARQLGQATGLPVYHLDNLLWQPGWQRLPEAAFDREHDALIAQPAWIIDGVAYAPALERRLAAADEIVFIDFPLWRHYYWALKRQLKTLFVPRPEVAAGRAKLAHFRQIIQVIQRVDRELRPRWLALLQDYTEEKEITVIRRKKALAAYLAQQN